MRRIAMWTGLWCALTVAGCGEESVTVIDAATDAIGRDGGVEEIDAAEIDAATIDAAPVDAPQDCGCVADAPPIDAALIDAATIDAALIDAALIDAAITDAAITDASAIDAATIDAPVLPPVDAPAINGPGCADGVREGFNDGNIFPGLAACAGAWTGDVALAAPLCATGWHVCRGPEQPLRAATYAQATAFAGCFAIDAAQDNWMCFPGCAAAVASGIDTPTGIDMGGVGASCPFLIPGQTACVTGGRIDVSENSGTGCNFVPGLTTGVVCCVDVIVTPA